MKRMDRDPDYRHLFVITDLPNEFPGGLYKTSLMRKIEARFHSPIDVLLRHLYCEQHIPLLDIGQYLGIGETTVRLWLIKFNIPIRDLSQARQVADLTNHREVMVQKYATMRRNTFGGELKDSLIRMHYMEHLTPDEIAQKTGYTYSMISGFMKEYGIRNMTPRADWIKKNTELGNLLPDIWSDPTRIRCLGERELHVITRRHLSGDAPTLEEVAYELGVTKQAVSLLESAALCKLRTSLKRETTTK